MEVLKLTKDGIELFVEASGQAYLLATEFGWAREYVVLDTPITLNELTDIK